MASDGEPDDLEDLEDLDEPWSQPEPSVPRLSRRTTGVLLAGGAVAVAGALVASSALLRTPQERLEVRLGDALDAAGVQLAAPVSLYGGDAGARLWMARLAVLDDDGGTTTVVRLAVQVDDTGASAPSPVEAVFPLVDCGTRYPLSYPGDSDSSFRTSRSDLVECVSTPREEDGVLVTIAWADEADAEGGDGDGDGRGGAGPLAVDRQTWLTDGRGGLVWLYDAGGGGGSGTGLTGEQQRAVATAEGLLDAL